jgi:hypothetical protein
MFTPANARILLAISSPSVGCPIPEFYWRVDFLDRSVEQSPKTLLFLRDSPLPRGGQTRRGAVLLRPSEGRDKIAPLPSVAAEPR